jgi:hypothetical protein
MFLSGAVVSTMLGLTLAVGGVAIMLWSTAAACGLIVGHISGNIVRWVGLAWLVVATMAVAILFGIS